jgi:hypothetical protein
MIMLVLISKIVTKYTHIPTNFSISPDFELAINFGIESF